MDEPNLTELRQRFRKLRVSERARAPAFQRFVPPAQRVNAFRVLRWTLAAAALVGGLWIALPERGLETPGELLPDWRAPTDVLLETPGQATLRELPRLDTSVLDAFINLNATTKGDIP